MDIRYAKGRLKGFLQKYWGLSRLLWDEFKIGGLGGAFFAVRRHFKKRKGQLPVTYPTFNDYEKNLVSIIILTKDHLDLIQPCLESIEKNLSEKYRVEILIGDTGSLDRKVKEFYRKIKKRRKNVKVLNLKYYFFSKNNNYISRNYAKGEYLILLNNDTIVKENWIDELIDPLANKKIGVVGGKLLYKDGTIQHAGIEFNAEGNGYHIFSKQPGDLPEANFKAYVPAVTFACAAMRHDVFDRFGLGEDFQEEAQDPDICFRLADAGFRILYNPNCEIYHFECSTRDWRKGEPDRQLLKNRWGKKIKKIFEKGNQRVKFNPDEYKNAITVIRDDGIGDILMGVSAFKNLRKYYPDRKLILATYERNIEMMDGFKVFDEFVPIPDGKKYSPLPIPSGEGSKVYNFIDLEMNFGPIWGRTKEDNKTNRHIIYTREMELDPKFELVPMPDYPEARKRVEKEMEGLGIDIDKFARGGQRFVVFNLIASNPARSWWEPYYPELIKAVEEMGFVPLILGTKDSEYYTGKKVVNLVGKTKTIAEFIEAVKLGKYVISTDTSAYHIAALSGIPFLAIFTGGIKPEARLGFYEKYEVLEPPASLECYPCWDEGCKDLTVRWKKDPCRLIIKPEEVVEKFRKLVEKYPR
jgi:GT2 family glycosyltransferase/ADP-heptose:LPS heptosyltransferase